MLMINLHYARTLLNPYLLGEVHLHDVVDAKETLNNFLQKTYGIPNAYALALKNFVNFVKSLSPFYDMPLVKDINLLPHEWWDLIGAGRCTLAPIIHYIFGASVFHIIVQTKSKFILIH